MTDTLKDYQFSDEQIDQLLRCVRNKAFQVRYNPHSENDAVRYNPYSEDNDYDYNELANLIEDQIVNHPTNS